jgi:hypothetical protein
MFGLLKIMRIFAAHRGVKLPQNEAKNPRETH